MPRFFIDKNIINKDNVIIEGEEAKHISKVLRMQIGDMLTLCDGEGLDYEAKIHFFDKNSVSAKIIAKKESITEPRVKVALFQGLPKSDKMEYIIQKCTELGISEIIPCIMDRCVVKLNSKSDIMKKTERYQSIALSGAKQAERGIVPAVSEPIEFDEVIDQMKKYDLCFVAYEEEKQASLKELFASSPSPESIAFLIGPEGGISEKEYKKICDAGIKTVTLGPRILRTETAPVAVLSMINYEFML